LRFGHLRFLDQIPSKNSDFGFRWQENHLQMANYRYWIPIDS